MPAKVVVLLSGGLDSATCLAIAKSEGFDCYALSFDYGQRGSENEINSAERVCAALDLPPPKIFQINLNQFGGSALVDQNIAIPSELTDDIPVTYVPARNTIFLSLALAYAEVIGALHIYYGANSIDYSGYPDCRPEYLAQFENLANLATKVSSEGGRMRVCAPLMYKTKAEIIAWGTSLGLDYSLTVSCYDSDPMGRACGRCESCQLRREGFAAAGVPDPTTYYSR